MMKSVNLLSVIEAYKSLNSVLFQKFMNNFGILVNDKRGIRDYELDCIENFVNNLLNEGEDVIVTTNFYLGYSIPQIGKEFDLLRFGDNYIINIEIKTECTVENILKQQKKNQYYLEFLEKDIYIYTYISKENKLYKFVQEGNNESSQEVSFSELYHKLLEQTTIITNNIDGMFNPSNYLVSPFNSTEKFIAGKYFLTVQQESICKDVQKRIDDSITNFIAITGNAGTGKTLLTYHIAKEYINKKHKVLILHCAQLNNGHKILSDNWGWDIHMARYMPDINNYDLIIVDEAQRIYPYQFTKIKEAIQGTNKKCIFSYDENQYLSNNEKAYNIKEKIENELKCVPFNLTNKIRTNKEIAYFTKQLFNKNKNISNISFPNIELMFCKDYISAKALLKALSENNWKVPIYTPGTRSTFHYEKYSSCDPDSAHSVIGQEFDNIAVVLDEHFKYNDSGILIADNTYYSQRQMLYQIITRAIKKLCVIIINNEIMLERTLEVLNKEMI